MKRAIILALAVLMPLQPLMADGLTREQKRAIAAQKGGPIDDDYDPAETARMFQVAPAPSNLPPGQIAARIKDVAQLQSARDNQLVGYGL
ncbi:MAG: flagellar biosynthesis protein FlgI, partial [Aquamicrobium sp.]|nr:flagellar biosynthesis protein FlgI [Aquamicrobium sp.]